MTDEELEGAAMALAEFIDEQGDNYALGTVAAMVRDLALRLADDVEEAVLGK